MAIVYRKPVHVFQLAGIQSEESNPLWHLAVVDQLGHVADIISRPVVFTKLMAVIDAAPPTFDAVSDAVDYMLEVRL